MKPEQLASLDQFHTRGLAATAELAELAGITADMSVLDVGSGVGGPARFLAATYGQHIRWRKPVRALAFIIYMLARVVLRGRSTT